MISFYPKLIKTLPETFNINQVTKKQGKLEWRGRIFSYFHMFLMTSSDSSQRSPYTKIAQICCQKGRNTSTEICVRQEGASRKHQKNYWHENDKEIIRKEISILLKSNEMVLTWLYKTMSVIISIIFYVFFCKFWTVMFSLFFVAPLLVSVL